MSRADRPIPFSSALRAMLLACLTLGAIAAPARAQLILEREQVRELDGVDMEEHLGAQIPLDATFTNAAGETAPLSSYFNDGKPAILVLVYYDCPVVCDVVLDKLVASLVKLDYTPGDEYRLLVISFDETENSTQALGQKLRFTRSFPRASDPAVSRAIAFHTGSETDIARLTEAVGFKFKRLGNGEFSHAAGLTVLSPEGKVTRYIYGYDYPTDQIKLSLLDATDGKIAKSLGERIMHYCFRYDPTAGAYSLEAMALMRLGGVLTVILLTVLIAALLIGERVRRRVHSRARSDHETPGEDRRPQAERFSPKPAGQVS
tara:strand:- start:47353 stop:48306 length:954 start_codon:yes stop_codon:yes gene_type:complete